MNENETEPETNKDERCQQDGCFLRKSVFRGLKRTLADTEEEQEFPGLGVTEEDSSAATEVNTGRPTRSIKGLVKPNQDTTYASSPSVLEGEKKIAGEEVRSQNLILLQRTNSPSPSSWSRSSGKFAGW